MKILLAVLLTLSAPFAANAYQIGRSYATLVSCNFAYNADYGTSGYTGDLPPKNMSTF